MEELEQMCKSGFRENVIQLTRETNRKERTLFVVRLLKKDNQTICPDAIRVDGHTLQGKSSKCILVDVVQRSPDYFVLQLPECTGERLVGTV